MQFIDLKTQYQSIQLDIQNQINTVLEHGQYIMGPEVKELETQLAEFVGTKNCIGVASGTDALLIALMALDIKPGDEVITTPFSFIATAETIALLGAKPVFVDIDPLTYNIDHNKIESAITKKTKAIMPVSIYGLCADLVAINYIANNHDLPVIEDGAQSFGATYKGNRSCGLTTIGCTSFFPSKPLGCYGDAGACFTNDDQLAEKMRQIRIHGQEKRYQHSLVGINGRIDTLQAAILLAKFKIFPKEIQQRSIVGNKYTELLQSCEKITVPFIEEQNQSVYAQFTISLTNRDELKDHLISNGIPCAVHYPKPLHLQPALKTNNTKSLTIAEESCKKVLSLPCHPYLTNKDIEIISNMIIEFV